MSAGARARDYLRYLLANDVAKLKDPGKALYSCMLNERGGVVDDLITYFGDESTFRVVVNAGTRDKDTAWLKRWAPPFQVDIQPRTDLAMVAVQGPNARAKAAKVIGKQRRRRARHEDLLLAASSIRHFVATHRLHRRGRLGNHPARAGHARRSGRRCATRASQQCGLGARDTLRLEAGMNLYGNDMDENLTPLESGLTWTVAFDPPERDFIGRAALEAQRRAGVPRKLVGLVLEDRGVLRSHQKVVVPGVGEGEMTSGTFSPTLERSIGFARVPAATGEQVQVDIRGKLLRGARREVSVRAQRQSADLNSHVTSHHHFTRCSAMSSIPAESEVPRLP